jgi:hypothetical protein
VDANRIIDELGGTGAVAKLCDVSEPAVSQWRANGIPPLRLKLLRYQRPKVFRRLEAERSAPVGSDDGQAA